MVVCLVGSLLGCGQTKREPDPILQFPSVGGSATTGGFSSGGAGAGGGAGTGGAGGSAGAPVEMQCAADLNPAPPPPGPVAGDITAVVPSDGCGRDYRCEPQVKRTLQTTGAKDADCADMLDGMHVCGAWSVPRDFWVMLPPGYDPQKPYPLVIEAPGCGGTGASVYAFDDVRSQVIRVGISPGPSSTGHATNPEQGCFDDHEGDDSIDWVFYERLYDRLNDELCFDRRRVFASGDGSGGTIANELGCKYAGDPVRPVRGVHAYNSSPPTEPQYLPTCSASPLAGVWVQELMSLESPVAGFERNVSRVMAASHCAGGDYDHAQLQNFPIGGGQPDDECKSIAGCDALYPLVVCPLRGSFQSNNPGINNFGFSTFAKLFMREPLLPPQ